jgi:ATP-dependent helicase/nuclease subunit B
VSMSAEVHLVKGPSSTSRIGQLLGALRKASAEFRSALVLAPTRRLADQLRELLGNCLAPLIFEFQAFGDELVRVNDRNWLPHSELDRRLLLDSIVAEFGNRALPDYARVIDTRGFAQAAVGCVEELKCAGIDVRQILKSSGAGTAERTRLYQTTRMFDRYERRLAKLHRFDPSDRLARAARLWTRSRRRPFEVVRSVFLAGFGSFTHHQQQLLKAIRNTVEHLWVEWPDGMPDPFSESVPRTEASDPSVSPPESRVAIAPSSVFTHLIEAAGEVGEARLVARHVRQTLARGTRPDRIVVVARHFSPAALALFEEVFNQYHIPVDLEGAQGIGTAPAVAFLLRAWRLPDDGWEFTAVTSILRSTFFRPNWPEVVEDPEVANKAEALLRILGEARGRESYLRAIAAWEQAPPEPLEDEHPQEPLRRRKQELARVCRPFLEHFFKLWDSARSDRTASDAVARLESFAEELGLSRANSDDLEDLARFWQTLDRWARSESNTGNRKLQERFARILASLAMAPGRARSSRGEGVLLLSADRAVGLDCDSLYLVGLGEGTWPDLTAADSLLDESDRKRLKKTGLPGPETRFAKEQQLFATLVTAPRRELVLSFAAVDDKGQASLPCSFLREFLEKSPGISIMRQRMPLDGYFDQPPMCEAELRTRSARFSRLGPPLAPEIIDNLSRARSVARARFENKAFGAFDGALAHSATRNELTRRLGPAQVFSPTALETYISCPFRFLLQYILRLEPLGDPSEEVEYTRRGSAVHRALARFHARAGFPPSAEPADLPLTVTDDLVEQIERAVGEYAARAPSRASAELWRLEGKRLARAAGRYRRHWAAFRAPWREKSLSPAPHHFEASFGVTGAEGAQPLVLTIGGVEVRIGGCIDRVDLVQLEETVGFWVIDYKTGRAANYQASQVARFERLQLPLYALAVERVLLKDRPARPLGLAYWLVTDTGAKLMLPSGRKALAWIADAEAWTRFSQQLEKWVARIVTHIRAGDFPLSPRSATCTDTCAFGSVCRIAQSRNTGKVFPLELPVLDSEPEN